MHLCFMTFSVPEYTLSQVLTTAIRYGYDGVEPRTVAGHKHGIELELTKAQRAEVKSAFSDCGVRMSCLATSLTYAAFEEAVVDARVEETKRYLQLASDVGSPNLRVFGGGWPEGMEEEQAISTVAGALARCAAAADNCNVNLCLETHDGFCEARKVGAVIAQANHPRVGANWDFAHSVRVGESIEESYAYLKGHVYHTHIHDITWPEDNIHELSFAPMGTGMVPHLEPIKLLAAEPAEIALSLEWESGENSDEVLPREAGVLREYMAEARGA